VVPLKVRLVLLVTALTVLVGVAAAVPAYLVARHNTAPTAMQLPRVSGLPADMPTSLANLMSLSALPRTPAPGFTLTDQQGHRLTLASLRGKVVVLQFMDPHCTDICPLVSQEFLDAYHDLGARAGQVVFAAINVNPYHTSVSAMDAYSREQGLITIPGWHFFTGPVAQLRSVWQGYHIAVDAPNPDADVQHTSAVYLIDQRGRERYLAIPVADHTKSGTAYLPAKQLASWGHGIALLAKDLLD
jgi:cytochrome oxidase Cu insertion factor (SCO1/SenC/PrrC family)